MRTLIIVLLFATRVGAQPALVDDLFVIFNSSKEGSDSLMKQHGFIPLPVDLKTGKVLEESLLWGPNGWCEQGEQTLFEYKHPASDVRYGFFWDREVWRTEDIGLAMSPEDSLGLTNKLVERGLFRIYDKSHHEDIVFTNTDKDLVLIIMPAIGHDLVMIGLFHKENELAKRYLAEDKKVKKKR